MKKLMFLSLAVLMMLAAISCKKDKATAPKVPESAVDLGIVMTREDGTTYKLYWAKSNLSESGLCANSEDYGDYYAWGETSPKDIYGWSTYKFGTSKDGPFSKYNTDDNRTILETGAEGDDVASKILGGKWRMPTKKEWEALSSQCDWTWTDDYNYTGVAGVIVTGNVEGYKDKSIFLPAAGYWKDDGSLHDKGSYGDYWSSSLSTDTPSEAYLVWFGRKDVSWVYYYRYVGYSVRPVWEE